MLNMSSAFSMQGSVAGAWKLWWLDSAKDTDSVLRVVKADSQNGQHNTFLTESSKVCCGDFNAPNI